MSSVTAAINTSALLRNYTYISSLASHSKVFCVVKANAYGHGIVEITKALSNIADGFSVARFEEAHKIKSISPSTPVLILGGVSNAEELSNAISSGFSFTLHNWHQVHIFLDFIKRTTLERISPIQLWLKIDTGMHRLGFQHSEINDVIHAIRSSGFKHKINLITHFACADDPPHNKNQDQLKEYRKIYDAFKNDIGFSSLSNSALTFSNQKYHKDWIRPGIALYGSRSFIKESPNNELVGNVNKLEAVMHLKSVVTSVRLVDAGQYVGYSADYKLEAQSWIASIGIGYGDGYPRSARNGTPILINGKIARLFGRVSMDTITVQLQDKEHASVGDEAVLWNDILTVDEVAQYCNTISYDLLTGISGRVKRLYISE